MPGSTRERANDGSRLKTLLGRVIRDIQRKCPEPDPKLKEELKQAQRIYSQQKKDKGKVYSVHASGVECSIIGKAHKRYKFGVKVSVVTCSRGGWHVAAQAQPGNPHGEHTLKWTLDQVWRMVEPGISLVKHGHRINRNRLKGIQGDQLNAVLSGAGMNSESCSSERRRLGSKSDGYLSWHKLNYRYPSSQTQLLIFVRLHGNDFSVLTN
jgi:IS5 family transposase